MDELKVPIRLGLPFFVLLVAGLTVTAYGEGTKNLDSMSIEELLNVEVSSAARKPQRHHSVPAAVFVITREDIAHSTATTIPELLRMAPGVNVARLDASKWSVTIRGFSGAAADKLLVLVDGRSVYSVTFAGTSWEYIPYPLELIERIEVIRGAGGATWGANAVNGIINIITRSPDTIDGGIASLSVGTDVNADLSLLYGGPIGTDHHTRLFLRGLAVDGGGIRTPGTPVDDHWQAVHGGLAFEGHWGDDLLSIGLEGMASDINDSYELSIFRPPFRSFYNDPTRTQDVNLIGRWERALGDDSHLQLQANFQRYDSDSLLIDEARSVGDIDFQHRFEVSPRQEIVWGLGARYTEDHITNNNLAGLYPARRRYRTASAFFQDEFTFLDGDLKLSIGTRLEHNDFTGFELQPTARLAWTPSDRSTWWAAITRAVGTPSRAETDIRLRAFAIPGFDALLVGGKDLVSETVISAELGHRRSLSDTLSVDAAIFYSEYDDFRTTVLAPPFISFHALPPRITAQFIAANGASATTKGFEIVLDWKPNPRWHTRLMWSHLEIGVHARTPYPDFITPTLSDDTPANQVNWQHRLALSDHVNLDVDLRYVGRLKSLDTDAYTTMDVRLGWRPREDLEIEIGGRNLLQSDHTEISSTILGALPSTTERAVYGQITWEF